MSDMERAPWERRRFGRVCEGKYRHQIAMSNGSIYRAIRHRLGLSQSEMARQARHQAKRLSVSGKGEEYVLPSRIRRVA
jgi:hypothetical protein